MTGNKDKKIWKTYLPKPQRKPAILDSITLQALINWTPYSLLSLCWSFRWNLQNWLAICSAWNSELLSQLHETSAWCSWWVNISKIWEEQLKEAVAGVIYSMSCFNNIPHNSSAIGFWTCSTALTTSTLSHLVYKWHGLAVPTHTKVWNHCTVG